VYYVGDHLGSIVRTTDSLGTPTLTRQYDPWGNPIQGSTTSGYAFTGREWDSEAGSYYYRARYYDSHLARFLSEDPEGLSAGLNSYAYVNNRPQNAIDPTGKRVQLRASFIHRLGTQIPGEHCFLFVKCQAHDDGTDNGGYLIGYLFPTYAFEDYLNNPAAAGHADVERSRSGDFERFPVFGSTPKTEQCLITMGKAYANQYIVDYRGVRGPNSNTYVHWLLSVCGAIAPAPPVGFGWGKVPGWNPGLTTSKAYRGSASDF
jgi:RHS repeat-associated protein